MSQKRDIRFSTGKSEVTDIGAAGNPAKQEFGRRNVLCASVGAAIGMGILSLLGCTESSQRFSGSENACIVSPTDTDRNVTDVANGFSKAACVSAWQ